MMCIRDRAARLSVISRSRSRNRRRPAIARTRAATCADQEMAIPRITTTTARHSASARRWRPFTRGLAPTRAQALRLHTACRRAPFLAHCPWKPPSTPNAPAVIRGAVFSHGALCKAVLPRGDLDSVPPRSPRRRIDRSRKARIPFQNLVDGLAADCQRQS